MTKHRHESIFSRMHSKSEGEELQGVRKCVQLTSASNVLTTSTFLELSCNTHACCQCGYIEGKGKWGNDLCELSSVPDPARDFRHLHKTTEIRRKVRNGTFRMTVGLFRFIETCLVCALFRVFSAQTRVAHLWAATRKTTVNGTITCRWVLGGTCVPS